MKPIANFVVKRSKLALFGLVLIIGFSSILGFQVFPELKAGGYEDNGSQSALVSRLLQSKFAEKPADAIIIADFKKVVDDPSSIAIAKSLTDELEAVSGVKKVTSYYSLGNPASLRSTDSHATYFFINFDTKAQPGPIATDLQGKFSKFYHGAKLYVAG
ncbi:MAG: hypothetical protein WCO24_02895, partial [Actinomycetes bacterium]